MEAIDRYSSYDDTPREDHVIFLADVSWDDYERLLAMRGDHSAPASPTSQGPSRS
jgi:hypothetical protein